MPELSVNITNNCACVHKNVKLDCTNFHSYEGVDPLILSVPIDEICLLKNGNDFVAFEIVKFLYAWEPQFPFTPISSQVLCP
ncbi:hypothetical protein Lalb_Chr17g0336761 [Lupinus albus]|uniref:Uncharacterized protein n=1 Tax=Lupinus albus TaxID=3870 RepID=A0A6A4NNG4_LUPAL|nr:hypothetical protein Lalb_Chr17g0336761 [Lupinus albus]